MKNLKKISHFNEKHTILNLHDNIISHDFDSKVQIGP